jgi:hypothetical protein
MICLARLSFPIPHFVCRLAIFIQTIQHLSVLASNSLSLVHCSLMALQVCPYVERLGTHIALEATDVSLRSRSLIERHIMQSFLGPFCIERYVSIGYLSGPILCLQSYNLHSDISRGNLHGHRLSHHHRSYVPFSHGDPNLPAD